MQHFICKWVIASHVKSSFFLLCSLALCQQSSWMGSAVRAGGEGSVMQHHSEKEVKSCFLFWPGRPLARIFNKESWAQGITENYLRAARLLRSGLRLLWGQSLLERAKVPRECSMSSTKGWFSRSSECAIKLTASMSALLLPFGKGCCHLGNWETHQCLVSGPVLERAGRHGISKPSSIRNWFGDLGSCFLGAFQE